MKTNPLAPELLQKLDAYWRAANYLSVGQIYLFDNPLLKRPLTLTDIKHMLLGHWGTTPGQNFICVHLNRVIKKYDLDMIYVSGPGHGGPAVVANTYLEGTYSEIYPNISQDEAGLQKLFKQFSFPGGIPSHASPECPGSIHEGGELGYASHRYALLLIFQGMDAGGKDGAIRHVMSGVNPQGCEVFSFKQPTADELEHDFLWRTNRHLPERGRIGIFNRSYYEEVLVVRVHPEILRNQGLPAELRDEKSYLEGAVSVHHGFGAAPASQRHTHRQIFPAPVEGRTAKTIPRTH